MVAITTTFIYLGNVLSVLLKKKSKVLLFLMLFILVILMGANTENPDIYAYQLNYAKEDLDSLEIGYWAIKRLCIYLGFDYKGFRVITSVLGFSLINHTVKKIINDQSLFYLAYFIYPFLLDVVQVRNFLAMALLIYAVPFLLNIHRFDNLRFIIFVLLAASMQTSAIVYLPIIFFIKKKKSVLFKVLYAEIVIFLILVTLNPSALDVFSQVLVDKLNLYDDRIGEFAFRQTKWGFLLFWIMQFANFSLVVWSSKNYKHNNKLCSRTLIHTQSDQIASDDFQKKYITLMVWINAYAFLFLPFYVFQSTFSRFMRNIVPLNLLVYIILSKNLPSTSIKKIMFPIIFIGYNFILFYIDIYILYNESIVDAIFSYNWLVE